MASPRFRCAQEVGFIPAPGGMRRVQLDEEFDFDGKVLRLGEEITLPPGPWMDPVNEEARELVMALVKAKKRRRVEADSVADTKPVQPPRSGISLSLEQQGIHNANVDAPAPPSEAPERSPPRRRARAN